MCSVHGARTMESTIQSTYYTASYTLAALKRVAPRPFEARASPAGTEGRRGPDRTILGVGERVPRGIEGTLCGRGVAEGDLYNA